MSNGDWMCGACQHINFKKRDACQRCQCPKFATPAEMSNYGIDRTEVLAGDWYCSTFNCGSHNYASRTAITLTILVPFQVGKVAIGFAIG
ncbi:unnamed protein product [Lactuca virosa]|uniref:RanBP2-type domain-containing protein n=1 Tax=Lactuca virosa TaxID=75947 RepID=A0AAU9N2Q3_9ASTR|nr:unnamed protein product [Lactuca virosa]